MRNVLYLTYSLRLVLYELSFLQTAISTGLERATKVTVVTPVTLKLSTMLKQLMKERKISLRELAKSTAIQPSTLSGWNNGSSPRDLSEVCQCARYLGVSMEYLLFGEEPDSLPLEQLLTEKVFDGFLKVKIERVINKKRGDAK